MAPWAPEFEFEGDEATWYYYHEVFFRRPVWGVDLIDTYGPMAFVWHRFYHPDTYLPSLLINLGLAIVLATGTWFAIREAPWHWAVRLAAGLIVLTMFASDRDCRPIVLAMIMILTAPSKDSAPPTRGLFAFRIGASASLGLYSLMKTSAALAAGVWLAIALGALLVARRGRWIEIAVFLISTMGWLVYAGQSPSAWTTYFRGAFVYVQDVGRFIRWGSQAELIGFLVMAAIYGFLALRWNLLRRGKAGLWETTGLAALLFLAFKAGFVTHNGHHVTHAIATLIAVAILHASLEGRDVANVLAQNKELRLTSIGAGAISVMALVFWLSMNPGFVVHKMPKLLANIEAVPRVLVGKHDYGKLLAETHADLRRRFPFPPMEGSVSLYAWRGPLIAVLASGLELRHFVTLHGFFWPESLDSLNRGFFSGPRRPDHVVVGRLLGSMTELTIAENFRPVRPFETESGDWIDFARRAEPARLVPAGDSLVVEGAWRQRLTFPDIDADIVVAEFDLRRTVFGYAAALFFKLPTLETLQVAPSGERFWRADMPFGVNRLILRPYATADATELAALAGDAIDDQMRSRRAVGLDFGLVPGAFDWLAELGLQKTIRVTLHPLKWEKSPAS